MDHAGKRTGLEGAEGDGLGEESVGPWKSEQESNPLRTQSYLSDRKTGALAKYQRMIVGTTGIPGLLKYELLTGLFGGMPGLPGLALRSYFYRFLLKKIGKGVAIGRDVTIRHPNRIEIGNRVVIEDGAVLDARGESGIRIHDGVFIGRGTILSARNGQVEIEEGASISSYCRITSTRIGRKVLIAANVYSIGGGHTSDLVEIPIIDQPVEFRGGIEIGDGSWIGAFTAIMDGVCIGNDVIIGAHSMVTKDISPFAVAYGVPASVRRDRRDRKGETERTL